MSDATMVMMTGTILTLAVCCALLSLVVAFLSATVPALWWLFLRQSGRVDAVQKDASEAKADVAKLDEVADRLCKAANLEVR